MQIEKGRLGQFFVVLGLIALAIFFTTDQAQNPTYGFFLAGFLLTLLGGFIIWRDHKPPPPTERFKTYRRIRDKQAERKAQQKDKKKKH